MMWVLVGCVVFAGVAGLAALALSGQIERDGNDRRF